MIKRNDVYIQREKDKPPISIKPALLTLAIAQALAIMSAQAANVVVTSNLDDGSDCTLREAISTVNAGADQFNGCTINTSINAIGTDDTITFDPVVSGHTITLTQGELQITKNVSINPGGDNTTIDADQNSRVMSVNSKYGTGLTAALNGLTISGGNTAGPGGGISVMSQAGPDGFYLPENKAAIILANSTVSGNTAESSGGGIFGSAVTDITLTNSTVSGNTADFGGGINSFGLSLTINNSTISGNSAERDGGGINRFGPSFTVSNSTVSGNSAGRDGGGLMILLGVGATITNSTLTGNSAGVHGGGIFANFYSTVTLSNSIIANTMGSDCVVGISSITAKSDTISEDGSCSFTALAVDPLLGPLADNGGPTQTHALLTGSPAIDNGTGSGATDTDQRGVAAAGVRDSGAYEFTGTVNALTIEKLINHHASETPADAVRLLAGTRYRADYKVTNNSPDRFYRVRVFEDGQPVCEMYDLMPGQSKQPVRCANFSQVLSGLNNVPAKVTAIVSGSNEYLADQTSAYYKGFTNVTGQLKVTHYVNNRNADTMSSAVTVNDDQAEILFRVENTGSIKLYRVKTYHDPASPDNSGWEEQCALGTMAPGQVRYCKRTINLTHTGLNSSFGRVQGQDANVSPTGYVNASNPTYFNVALP